jgi:preprotein translocase subunit SecA
MAGIARGLIPGKHYRADADGRSVHLTEAGTGAAERALGGVDLYASEQLETLTRLNVALYARALLERDVDYIVRDGRVHLVSQSRGRVARLQRWPDGLHAAVEAKEGLAASESGEVLDSMTTQALVGRYPTACGMTGTALAVGEQLREFYRLEVAVIPPDRPCVREDQPDRLHQTLAQKEDAITAEVADAHAAGRPVLIGTLDIQESERLAQRLAHDGLQCVVLNAKNDAEEAAIIAEAGAPGAITVSTQMAGRGTDIRLGGRDGTGERAERVARLGGLQVIGTGRHASSRLDDQLRGRSGRQGDPGGSVFFVSMQDELIAAYAADTAPPREVAADGLITDPRAHAAVRHAQRAAQDAGLQVHRTTWRYSKLVEDQRRVILAHRDRILRTGDALQALAASCPERHAELSAAFDEEVVVRAARQITLYHLDRAWADHLAQLADIREGIHLRALGHGPNPFVMALDPLAEFHAEAVTLFGRLLEHVERRCAETFAAAEVTAAGADLAAAGLKRPTATWTYLVQDNPFGSDLDRALRQLARGPRRRPRGDD